MDYFLRHPIRILPPLIALCILLLVPSGRYLQGLANRFAVSYPFLFSIALLLLGGILCVWVIFYCLLVRKTRSGLAILQLALVFTLLIFAFHHIDGIWVEGAHILLYSGFYISLRMCLPAKSAFTFLSVLAISLLLSLLDEGLQFLHPQRVADLRDITLNCISIALGIVLLEPRKYISYE